MAKYFYATKSRMQADPEGCIPAQFADMWSELMSNPKAAVYGSALPYASVDRLVIGEKK